ncbi:MAG: MBL fold metallo-hydrolase [Myxococcota bacterium]
MWEWAYLRAGRFGLDGGAMFGVIPKALWAERVSCDQENRIPLQTNCVLLQNHERNVLIETGCGNKFSDKERSIFALEERWIADALQEHKISCSEITDVVLTHLHFDHAGGLTTLNQEGVPISTFPQANIFVQRTEWEDALANRSTMTKTYRREHLDPIAEQVRCLDEATEIYPGLSVFPVPGHTWGQQAVVFHDARDVCCFPGDVIPTQHHVGDAFNMAYDMLPYQNMQTKRRLLQRAYKERWRLILGHEVAHPIFTVRKKKTGRFALDPTEERD